MSWDGACSLFRRCIEGMGYVDLTSQRRVVSKNLPVLHIPISKSVFKIQRDIIKFVFCIHSLSFIMSCKVKQRLDLTNSKILINCPIFNHTCLDICLLTFGINGCPKIRSKMVPSSDFFGFWQIASHAIFTWKLFSFPLHPP